MFFGVKTENIKFICHSLQNDTLKTHKSKLNAQFFTKETKQESCYNITLLEIQTKIIKKVQNELSSEHHRKDGILVPNQIRVICKIILNKMIDHNQFINLDFLKQPHKHIETPPKLNRNRSQSSKISKNSYILPRLQSRLSARKIPGRMGKVEVQGKSRMDSQIDYQVYLQQAKYRQHFSQLNFFPTLPVSLSKLAAYSPLDSIPQYPHSPPTKKKAMKLSQLIKDKQKFPIKYKILCQQLGYKEEDVFGLSDSQLKQLQEEYVKNKGKEYLMESRIRIKTEKQSKNQQIDQKIDQKKPFSLKNDKNYIREIFKEVSQAAKFKAKMRQLIQKQKSQKQLKQKRIKQYEQMLGNNVYKKVAKHLHATRKKKLGYDEQIKGQSKVDEALINFIKFKIKRAHTESN